MATLRIQRLEAEDWQVKRDVRLAALRDAPEAFGGNYADSASRTEEQWRAWPGDGTVFIGYLDDEPVGICAGAWYGDRHNLISMWVSPSARGLGLAAALTEAVCDWAADQARRSGAEPALWLEVKPDNDSARRGYLRAGFTPTDEIGKESGNLVMCRRL